MDAQSDSPADPAAAFLARHPGTEGLDAVFADLSGVVRGKRYPIDQLSKILSSGLAFPGSVFLLDAMGHSHDPAGHGFADGDPDCLAKVVPGSLQPVPWAPRPRCQVMITLEEVDGTPYRFEPRNVLARVAERVAALGYRPVVAFELEFYLIDPELGPDGAPRPPRPPAAGNRQSGTQVYGMSELEDFEALLDEIVKACRAQGVETGAMTAEYAPGQYEINLQHVADPLAAADDCVIFKRAVKGVARRHGLGATFMAKPYLQEAGSGLHMHVSLLGEDGGNVFDGGDATVSPTLHHAIGGILDILPESMALLAPNPNAYRRFQPNLFVPIRRSWGLENRSVALRVPLGPGAARRIEHRVAGADANPYLALATVLAGLHHGITNQVAPPPATSGNAGFAHDPRLPFRLRPALERLKRSKRLADYLGADYVEAYVACKLEELEAFDGAIPPREYAWYLQPA
jgi:glutamine synthetase